MTAKDDFVNCNSMKEIGEENTGNVVIIKVSTKNLAGKKVGSERESVSPTPPPPIFAISTAYITLKNTKKLSFYQCFGSGFIDSGSGSRSKQGLIKSVSNSDLDPKHCFLRRPEETFENSCVSPRADLKVINS
jgi:hypothetical protein